MKSNAPFPRDGARVLVVDDDPSSLIFLEGVLAGRGAHVTTAESVDLACAILEREGVEHFGAVITDCLMPVKTGIDLLRWVGERDPSLATVIITAGTERQIAAESLRGGACDFLEKPVGAAVLVEAVQRAITLTAERRQARATQAAVKDVGAYQHERLIANAGGADAWPLEVCFHPRCEAGGDFLNHFRIGGDRAAYLLTDVSGHDLKSAFLSAYFQGVVRGMMERQSNMPEIFDHFNRFLLSEWKQDAARVGASVAACSVVTDRAADVFEVVSCGSPLPVLTDAAGDVEIVGRADGYPLGWFPENPVSAVRGALPWGGSLLLWTDGVEALADEEQVPALALATALLLARRGLRAAPDLSQSSDDLLLVHLKFPRTGAAADGHFLPLLIEEHAGDRHRHIDQLQKNWERSIDYCLPTLNGASRYAIMLSLREAVLNGLVHGCQGRADRVLQVRASYDPDAALVRIAVTDPGTGHDFDLLRHEEALAESPVAVHRGLLLIKQLSDRLISERGGARLIMEFSLNRSWQ